MSTARTHWPAAAVGLILALLLTLTLAPYRGNITALFHADGYLASRRPLPPGFVTLSVPGYDGMEYYQIARNIPRIVRSTRWGELLHTPPGSYAYRRMLLPATAWLLALGSERSLPYAFLCVNLAAILSTAVLIARRTRGQWLPVLALALGPAETVALHFSLSEPLTILLVTLLLLRFERSKRMALADALLLALAVFSREVNILFPLAAAVYFVWRREWRSALWMLVPIAAFMALHGLIFAIFREVPFLMSAEKSTLPLKAIAGLLAGEQGYNRLTLSSIPLFLFFVLPATVAMALTVLREKTIGFTSWMLSAFLLTMLAMPDHIWGSITSIGRVITPVYPLFIFWTIEQPTFFSRAMCAALIALGLGAGLGLGLSIHPYLLS